MLVLTKTLLDEVIAHAREQHPVEACGIIAGPAGTHRPERLIRMRNILGSDVAYQFDPAEQIELFREMDERGEDPIVIYHSHTASAPIPSGTDTRTAHYPDAHYLIVSTVDPAQPVLRAWRLRRGVSVLLGADTQPPWDEEQIAIVHDQPHDGVQSSV